MWNIFYVSQKLIISLSTDYEEVANIINQSWKNKSWILIEQVGNCKFCRLRKEENCKFCQLDRKKTANFISWTNSSNYMRREKTHTHISLISCWERKKKLQISSIDHWKKSRNFIKHSLKRILLGWELRIWLSFFQIWIVIFVNQIGEKIIKFIIGWFVIFVNQMGEKITKFIIGWWKKKSQFLLLEFLLLAAEHDHEFHQLVSEQDQEFRQLNGEIIVIFVNWFSVEKPQISWIS